MPTSVGIELENLTANEEDGRITSYTGVYIVKDCVSGAGSSVLQSALEAIPVQPGSSPFAFPGLVLRKRTASLIRGTQNWVKVTCEFGPYQDVPTTTFKWEGSASLRQEQVSADYLGFPITVSYTYPANYVFDEELRGKQVSQTGSVPVSIPIWRLTGRGLIATDAPLNVTREFIGRVNSDPWMGAPARTWLCQDVSHKIYDISTSPITYEFTIVMECCLNTWEELVYFIDPKTNCPPSDIIYGIGKKRPYCYPSADFNARFSQ